MIWIDKIKEAIDYIENNLFETINTETVGKAINYAPSSFSNIFSAVVGYSVGEYIRFRRLSVSAEQFIKDNISVTETAFRCGYDTVESFSKAFKRLFGYTPSQFIESRPKYLKFSPININFSLNGGFSMTRNLIPGLQKVDWSDTARQNEFVKSVVSALNALGEKLDYDYVCAVSGSAFRTSFSMSTDGWNHGNYHVLHAPDIIEHTFKMLGYKMTQYNRGDYERDKKLITDSIDRGVPVITLEGVINCSDACVISGYDNDGDVLLGYSPFMYIGDDHDEPHDDTGYFRKSSWHDGFFSEDNHGRIIIIEGKGEKLQKEIIFADTLKIIKRLTEDVNIAPGQYNGIAAHSAFAHTLLGGKWDDNFEPYLNVMCNYKQYLDRQYAVKFFDDNGRRDLADIYREITVFCTELGKIIPQDFSAFDMFSEKAKLKPFCDVLLKISGLEEQAMGMIKLTE